MGKMIYGGDYNPEQWLHDPDILEEDLRLMKQAGINEATIGVFSWAILEPTENHYQFDWMRETIDRLWANGISVIMATPSGARPKWLAEKYPEVLRVDALGMKQKFGKRHNHCLTSKAYRKKVYEIDRKLAEEFGKHPAVKYWHISNELSGECFCESCQKAFREYLKEKYKTIENLNREWWTTFWSHTYNSFDDIEPPFEIGENELAGLVLDWKRFVTEETGAFIDNEKKAIRDGGASQPVTVNFMGDFDGLDYGMLHKHVDFVSWDSYPEWGSEPKRDCEASAIAGFMHDQMRSYKDQPFLLMESCPSSTNWQEVSRLKRPGLLTCASVEAIGHGADSVQYFQIRQSRGSGEKFHGALIDHTGRDDTRVYKEAAALGKILDNLDDVVGTKTSAKVALIYDMQNRWALDITQGPRNCGIGYKEYVWNLYGALKRHGIDVDVIDQDHDFSGYDVMFVPLLYSVRNDTVLRLENFTRAGGVLAVTYLSSYVDACDLVHLGETPYGLSKVLGVRRTEIDGLYDDQYNEVCVEETVQDLFSKKTYRLGKICELVDLLPDCATEVLGSYGCDFYKGQPVMTKNTYGKGAAYYLGAYSDEDLLIDWTGMILQSAGVSNRDLEQWVLPAGLNVQTRWDGDSRYLFFENYSEEALTAPLKVEHSVEVLAGAKDLTIEPYGILVVKLQDVFYKGVDISSIPEAEAHGLVIHDQTGEKKKDVFDLLRSHGVNAVRLRLWHDPASVPEAAGYCDLSHTLEMAKRIVASGMDFLLDFHYSDYWADPGQQKKPHLWENLHGKDLETAVYEYTKNVLVEMHKEGVLPCAVSIGNEIRSGFLFPDGELPDGLPVMVKLINAGIRAVREVSLQYRQKENGIRVILHLDQGGRYSMLSRWFEDALQNGLADFDIIGLSYYPFWHGTFRDLKHTMEQLVKDYSKPIMIMETAYAYCTEPDGFIQQDQVDLSGIPATPAGQKEVLDLVMMLNASLPDHMGQGVFYWEPIGHPECAGGQWSVNMSILNRDHTAMEAIQSFELSREEAAKQDLILPQVGEERADTEECSDGNLLCDAGLQDLTNWNIVWKGSEGDMEPKACHQGETAFYFQSPANFTCSILQTVIVPEDGTYQLCAIYRGVDTTGVNIKMVIKDSGEEDGNLLEQVIHPVDWFKKYRAPSLVLTAGQVIDVGIHIEAPPIYGMIKEIEFKKV